MDCFASLAMTRRHTCAFSRRGFARVMRVSRRTLDERRRKNQRPRNGRRAQGKPGAGGTRRSRAPEHTGIPCAEAHGQGLQVQPGHPGFPCAMVLRLLRDLPGVPGLLAPVASRDRETCPQRRGDRTTRLDRPQLPRTPCEETSGHRSLSRVRGDHDPPLLLGQDARKFAGVLPDAQSDLFFS